MIDDETRRDFSRNGNLRIAKRNSGIWWSLGLLSLAGGGYLIVSLPGILIAIGMLIYAEAHLRRILSGYATYYNQVRTHLALQKDAPLHRSIRRSGAILAITILAGLHHQYVRM